MANFTTSSMKNLVQTRCFAAFEQPGGTAWLHFSRIHLLRWDASVCLAIGSYLVRPPNLWVLWLWMALAFWRFLMIFAAMTYMRIKIQSKYHAKQWICYSSIDSILLLSLRFATVNDQCLNCIELYHLSPLPSASCSTKWPLKKNFVWSNCWPSERPSIA